MTIPRVQPESLTLSTNWTGVNLYKENSNDGNPYTHRYTCNVYTIYSAYTILQTRLHGDKTHLLYMY